MPKWAMALALLGLLEFVLICIGISRDSDIDQQLGDYQRKRYAFPLTYRRRLHNRGATCREQARLWNGRRAAALNLITLYDTPQQIVLQAEADEAGRQAKRFLDDAAYFDSIIKDEVYRRFVSRP